MTAQDDTYGFDVATTPDLDPAFRPVRGPAAVGHAVARRFETPRGSLPWDPNGGYDLRALLSQGVAESDLYRIAGELEAEAEKDERVLGATAAVVIDVAGGRLRASVELELATGTFRLVLAIDRVSVSILSFEPV